MVSAGQVVVLIYGKCDEQDQIQKSSNTDIRILMESTLFEEEIVFFFGCPDIEL